MQQTHPDAITPPYPLPAQSFHHFIQTVVRHSGGDAGEGLSTVQLVFQLNNLTFKRLVLLLKTTGLEGHRNRWSPNRYILRIYRFTASFTKNKGVTQQREKKMLMCH